MLHMPILKEPYFCTLVYWPTCKDMVFLANQAAVLPHLLTVVFAALLSLSNVSSDYQSAARGADAELGTLVSHGDEREVHSQPTRQTRYCGRARPHALRGTSRRSVFTILRRSYGGIRVRRPRERQSSSFGCDGVRERVCRTRAEVREQMWAEF